MRQIRIVTMCIISGWYWRSDQNNKSPYARFNRLLNSFSQSVYRITAQQNVIHFYLTVMHHDIHLIQWHTICVFHLVRILQRISSKFYYEQMLNLSHQCNFIMLLLDDASTMNLNHHRHRVRPSSSPTTTTTVESSFNEGFVSHWVAQLNSFPAN